MPSQAWDELKSYGFRSESVRSTPGLFDLDPVPGRETPANELPSAPKDHTPREDDFPAGWTVQHPYGRIPDLPPLICGLCGQIDESSVHSCAVLEMLSASAE